jgi:hypothetical protein
MFSEGRGLNIVWVGNLGCNERVVLIGWVGNGFWRNQFEEF